MLLYFSFGGWGSRWLFDVYYYLIRRYDAMYDKNPEVAETFGMQIGDIVDNSIGMTNDEFRDALCDPYDLILDTINGKAW